VTAPSGHPAEPPYPIVLSHTENGDEPAWTATVEELPGCEAHGPTPERAAAAVAEAVERWVRQAEAEGRDVPPPGAAATHSGKLLVRMPRSLHAELVRASEREGTSLNAYIVAALAATIAWRRTDAAVERDTPPPGGALSRALAINLVVLLLVAAIAVGLLIAAWAD
jgi:predicted RNase H-like HicB family nuclease